MFSFKGFFLRYDEALKQIYKYGFLYIIDQPQIVISYIVVDHCKKYCVYEEEEKYYS